MVKKLLNSNNKFWLHCSLTTFILEIATLLRLTWEDILIDGEVIRNPCWYFCNSYYNSDLNIMYSWWARLWTRRCVFFFHVILMAFYALFPSKNEVKRISLLLGKKKALNNMRITSKTKKKNRISWGLVNSWNC